MKATDRLAGALAQRTPRERRLLAAAALVVGAAALVTLADGLVHERTRLARALPDARAELARMQDDAAELQRLRQIPAPTAATPATLLESARAAAAARGLGLSITAAGDTLQARGNADFDALVGWLAAMQSELQLRPLRATIDARGDAVGVEIELAPAASR